MDILQAVKQRHTVRQYTTQPLATELIAQIEQQLSQYNQQYHLQLTLCVSDSSINNLTTRLAGGKDVMNYVVLAGPKTPEVDFQLGYVGADLLLFLQMLGLNSWWIGVTYQRIRLTLDFPHSQIAGIIALGYGNTSGKAHHSKKPSEVSLYNGSVQPIWFVNGVSTALLAPTAHNRQSFTILGKDNKAAVICENRRGDNLEKGIITRFFEVGAGADQFVWLGDEKG